MKEDAVQGEVLRVTFRSDENDWSVLKVQVRGHREPVTVVGITQAQVGQIVTACGRWALRQGEPQFQADRITAAHPTSAEGLAAYLGSGVLPGIGPKKAQQMVRVFGTGILHTLDHEPERLAEIRGFGPATVERIKAGWKEQKAVQAIMLFLHSHNISAALCRRIYRAYGERSIEIIQANPFQLCLDVRGIGFKTADAIARQLGIPPESPHRILAGLVHLMQEAMTQGHCGQRRPDLLAKAQEALGVPQAVVAAVLDADVRAQGDRRPQFVQHDDGVYLAWLDAAETFIAETFIGRVGLRNPWAQRGLALIEAAAQAAGMQLAAKQRLAIETALTHRVSIITGGPGVGKTSTLHVLLDIFRRLKLRMALAAPTGKAAQRAAEATGIPASTIHRLLGLRGPGADPGELHADVLVLDECSMIDVPLMRQICRAWKRQTALVLVGDVDQLPSVGPGQVLADLIRSGVVPTVQLDEVFRQAAGSLIIRNAHAINRGHMPDSGGPEDDFFILDERNTPSLRQALACEDDERPAAVGRATAQIIEDLVRTRLPAKYGWHPARDIQVLCPMNKGAAGVAEMNARLQRALNPHPARSVTRYGIRFGVGDKVIQTRNNYDLEIFNGDMGFVFDCDDENGELVVDFEGRRVRIAYDDLDDLRLAYALTIHKSQGSQAPAIIMPMVTQHWTMLQRNLLYTGVTRARRLVVLVGQRRAIAAAVRTVSAARRLTRLRTLLQTCDPTQHATTFDLEMA